MVENPTKTLCFRYLIILFMWEGVVVNIYYKFVCFFWCNCSDMLSLDIRQVIEKFLYHPSKWRLGSKPEKMFKYLWKHYGDEMLQVLVDFDTELDSVVTFTKLLELSSRASWNLQLTAFNRVVERIKDMSFSEVKMVLSYIQPVALCVLFCVVFFFSSVLSIYFIRCFVVVVRVRLLLDQ